MSIRRIFMAGSLVIAALAGAASPATAGSRSGSCNSGSYAGTNRFTYHDGGTNWVVDNIYYTLSPADGSRNKNNVNYVYFGGSNTISWNSPDSLPRTGTEQLLRSNVGYLGAKNGTAYFQFTDIFDTSAQPDPQCTTSRITLI